MTSHQQKAVKAINKIIRAVLRSIFRETHEFVASKELTAEMAQIIASHFPVLSEANGPEPSCCCAEVKEAVKKVYGYANLTKETDRKLLSDRLALLKRLAYAPCPRRSPDKCRCGGQVGWYHPGKKRFCYLDEKSHANQIGGYNGYTLPVYVGKLESAIRKEW